LGPERRRGVRSAPASGPGGHLLYLRVPRRGIPHSARRPDSLVESAPAEARAYESGHESFPPLAPRASPLEDTRMFRRFALASIAIALAPAALRAQTFGPNFAADYSFVDLGTPSGVPARLGGVTFKPNDPNTLWIGGAANSPIGAIYEIGVTRNAQGHITGFNGTATLH